jgi:integrase
MSEVRLRWSDVNWDKGRMTVRSPRTEHHKGKDARLVPLFPEVRRELQRALGEGDVLPDPRTDPALHDPFRASPAIARHHRRARDR